MDDKNKKTVNKIENSLVDDKKKDGRSGPPTEKQLQHRFKKGQSGNPNGRPKIPESIREEFKKLTPKAISTLNDIISNPDAADRDRIRAAEVVLDRSLGKPVQAVDVDTNLKSDPVTIVFEGVLSDWSK